MNRAQTNQMTNADKAETSWKDIYKISGVTCILIAVLIIFAILAFFIWPFKPGFTSTENIFATLQQDRLGGLMSLDLMMLLITPLNILPFLGMYMALRRINESYALIAVILALVAVILLITARPLAELVTLSDKYSAATSPAEKSQYLAAGESLHALFNGTAWIIQTIFFILAGIIDSWLMVYTRLFSKLTAYLGLVISIIGLGFVIPMVGAIFLFINTIGSVVWMILLARDFFRMENHP